MIKNLAYILAGVLFITLMQPCIASQGENTPIISLIVDVDVPASPDSEEIRSTELILNAFSNDLMKRDTTATLVLTQDVTISRIRLALARLTVASDFEFAISGKQSDDLLSTMTLSEQEALIKRSIEIAEAAKVCGLTEVNVAGFLPPGFDQNEDTYKVIDNLGFEYDAGFQAGLIYAPGHEADVWPYQLEGYNFSAVPISSAIVGEELLPLYDKRIVEEGIGASEWTGILKTKLDEAAAEDEPVVILLSTSVSGTGEYFEALKAFLDYAESKNASFVNGRDLVAIAKSGTSTPPEVLASECLNCGEDELGDLEIRLVETPAPVPEEIDDEETLQAEEIEA